MRRRVDQLFETTGLRQRDCPQMYVKTAVLLTAFALGYCLLVFVAHSWWLAIPLAIVMGLVTAGIGFNIQHDGGHHAYSARGFFNKLPAMTMDLIGGSSYLWHYKHVLYHHTYANIVGHDTDIDLGILGRLSPHQPHYWFHRWQHIYLWPLYGMLAIKWQLFDDFHNVIRGRIGSHPVRRPQGWDLILFLAGKSVFLTLVFVIPMLLHPVWTVIAIYCVAAIVTGMVLSVVFQLAHCVEGADFPLPHGTPERIDNAWAIHQVESTVDFARDSRLAAWLLGGLNFQIEHHLFPRICHINYPMMSKLVEETCREFGVRYIAHATFRAGVLSHYRWLRTMGVAPTPADETQALQRPAAHEGLLPS